MPIQNPAMLFLLSGSVAGPPDAWANARAVALDIMYCSSISDVSVSLVSKAGLSPPTIFKRLYRAVPCT